MRQLRTVALTLAMAVLISDSQAQQGRWQAVETLPAGSQISIQPIHGMRSHCQFTFADEHRIECEEASRPLPCLACILVPGIPPPRLYRPAVFDQKNVKQVHVEHPYANAFVGFAIGAGLGIVLGSQQGTDRDRTVARFTLGGIFGSIGAAIGKRVPIIRGTAVYEK